MPKAGQQRHGEAFCLMWYACECGHRERFWNGRDGITPFALGCPSCGGATLRHIHWNLDTPAPSHQPHDGQGVWRDGTPDEAEAIMRCRIESCKGTSYECDAEREALLVNAVRNPPAGEPSEFAPGWPMLDRYMAGGLIAAEIDRLVRLQPEGGDL
jgi:hypothetical protein